MTRLLLGMLLLGDLICKRFVVYSEQLACAVVISNAMSDVHSGIIVF